MEGGKGWSGGGGPLSALLGEMGEGGVAEELRHAFRFKSLPERAG